MPAKNNQPKNASNSNGKKNKNSSRKRRSNKAKGQRVPSTQALGTRLSGPLQLKTEQFAAYAPLSTFEVRTGSTPGGIRVRGRELIQSMANGATTLLFGADGGVLARAIDLDPGTFPRLTVYQQIYEMYKFHKAKVLFQSSQPTTAQGVAILAVDYDAKDTAPGSTSGMMRNISSAMSNVYADCALEIEGKLSRLDKYVCSEGSAIDVNQVTQANILYAFEGTVGTSVPQGYLVIEYDVEFFTPC